MGGNASSGSATGYAGPVGLLGQKPEYESNGEYYGNALTGGITNLFGNPVGQNEARRRNESQADSEKQRVQMEQDRRSGLVNTLRENYGIGNTPGAQAAGTKLSDYLKDYYNAYLSNSLGQVDNQYAGATRVGRQNLARVGQLGSGLDTQTRASNLADFIRSRQGAISSAAAARDSLSSSLTNQRLGLESQINAGTVANPDFAATAGQQQALIGQARAQIPSVAVGNAFTTAGQVYQQGAQQGQLGNQGLQAFGFSNSRGPGRIS